MKHWLFKTEPSTYSYSDLQKDGKTAWSGVRNFQARNFLRETSPGDLVMIYHSGDEKSVVGLARISREAYPDPDPKKPGDWVQIDLVPMEKFAEPVSLKQIKETPALGDMLLVRHTRLSCMPMTAKHFDTLVKLGKKGNPKAGQR